MDVSSDFADFRLPRGRHGLAPELVAENQRWRLIGASSEVLAAVGYEGLSSAAIAERAGVSKSALYTHFESVDQCVRAAYEMAADCVVELAADACSGLDADRPRLRAVLESILGFLAAEPSLAHLLAASTAAGDPAIAASHERLMLHLAELLRGKADSATDPSPPAAGRHIVAAAFALVSDSVTAGEAERLPELLPELTDLLSRSSPTGV